MSEPVLLQQKGTDMAQLSNCEFFNSAVSALFPNGFVMAKSVKLLGQDTIVISFGNETRERWINGIFENDPAALRAMVSREGDKFVIESPTFYSHLFRKANIKFRKIVKESEEAALESFVKWFAKNKDAINSLKKD
jgi:hypothetical protein